jgi:hypothetical protein
MFEHYPSINMLIHNDYWARNKAEPPFIEILVNHNLSYKDDFN